MIWFENNLWNQISFLLLQCYYSSNVLARLNYIDVYFLIIKPFSFNLLILINLVLWMLSDFRDMLPLNCQSTPSNGVSGVNGSVSSSGQNSNHQSLQPLDSGSPNLAMSPLSTMGMSPAGLNPCSPMGMSPMGPHHHGYATPVTPSSVHNGGLSPINDVKSLCYGRSLYDTGKRNSFTISEFLVVWLHQKISLYSKGLTLSQRFDCTQMVRLNSKGPTIIGVLISLLCTASHC